MKKRLFVLLISASLLLSGCVVEFESGNGSSDGNSISGDLTVSGEDIVLLNKEILFMDIPWGTTYKLVNEQHGELGLYPMNGESYKTYSIDDITLGDYKGIDFEYTDINVIGICYNNNINVAGYTTSDVSLYFSYIPNADGSLNQEADNSILYGARYEFEAKNLAEMQKDLTEKITSIYGEPQKETSAIDIYKNENYYLFWYGQNDTLLVLNAFNTENDTSGVFEDEITLSYVWLKGDDYLKKASDILKEQAIKEEADNYGSGNTDGL